MGNYAWVTLATNDSYALGALVLAHSLRQVGTTHELAVLITPGVTVAMKQRLSGVFNAVVEVDILDSRDELNLRLLKRPELGITFTKIHCWRLTKYDKCVFLDADTLVVDNVDELFERDELSAAPDVGWPDCFNSGVFVFKPSNETFMNLVDFAIEKGSFDGGDQGLLNLFFSNWASSDISKHLPFIYNMCATACYSYLPAFKQYGVNAKIIHFIGNTKPWLQYFDVETRKVVVSNDLLYLQPLLQRWWDIFCFLIHPTLSTDMEGLAKAFAELQLGVPRTTAQKMLDDHLRRQCWESGNIDYMGRDSFENIWSKICETLENPVPLVQPEFAVGPPVLEAADFPANVPNNEQGISEAEAEKQVLDPSDKLEKHAISEKCTTANVDSSKPPLVSPDTDTSEKPKTTSNDLTTKEPTSTTKPDPISKPETVTTDTGAPNSEAPILSVQVVPTTSEPSKTSEKDVEISTKSDQKIISTVQESSKLQEAVAADTSQNVPPSNIHTSLSEQPIIPTTQTSALLKDKPEIKTQTSTPLEGAQTPNVCEVSTKTVSVLPESPDIKPSKDIIPTTVQEVCLTASKETEPTIPIETFPTTQTSALLKDKPEIKTQTSTPLEGAQTPTVCEVSTKTVSVLPENQNLKPSKDTISTNVQEVCSTASKETEPTIPIKPVPTLSEKSVSKETAPSVRGKVETSATKPSSATTGPKPETTVGATAPSSDTPVAPPRKGTGSTGEKKKTGKGKK